MRDDALKMQADIEELNNSVTHLLRSNDELRAALEDEPADRDFLDAVAENELVVQKRRREVADLERKLEALTGHSMRSVPSAAPVHPAAEAAASEAHKLRRKNEALRRKLKTMTQKKRMWRHRAAIAYRMYHTLVKKAETA